MSLIAELRLAPDKLSFSECIEAVSSVELDVEREYATRTATPILFVWVRSDECTLDQFERVMGNDETVADTQRLSGQNGRRLYRIRLTGSAEVVTYPAWIEEAMRLEMRYTDSWWHCQMRFPDRSALSTFCTFCDERGVDFRLDRLYVSNSAANESSSRLTEPQRETLRLALDRGYFDVPRGVTAAELAASLDISSQAVSERIRRACKSLAKREFPDEW